MSEPIRITQPEPDRAPAPPAEAPPTTISYLITAVIFFLLGFMVAGLLGFNILSDNLTTDPNAVAQAVNGTLIALTPTITPIPPTATITPLRLTYSERDYILGTASEDAPITLVEFSDYQCPWCGLYAQDTLPLLMQKYEGYVNFIYRDFPIFGDQSIWAAHGAYCANQQEQFTAYHFALFDSRSQNPPLMFDAPGLTSLAETLELDTEQFAACLADSSIQQGITQNYIDGQYLLGRAGTPMFLLNGQRIEGAGSFEYFSRLIDEELQKLGIEPPA